MELAIKVFRSAQEMKGSFELLQHLYPNMTLEEYSAHLEVMLPHNYGQIAAFLDEKLVGLSGYWIGTKLWSGKYLEMDHVIVHPAYRSKKIGEAMTNFLRDIAKKENCKMLALDVYTTNYDGIRFYMNQGLKPRGFHMTEYL